MPRLAPSIAIFLAAKKQCKEKTLKEAAIRATAQKMAGKVDKEKADKKNRLVETKEEKHSPVNI